MSTGLSLPPAYLAGEPHRHWSVAFGNAGQALDALRQHEVESIELRTVQNRSDPAQVLAAARAVWSAGLRISIHGVLPVALDDPLPPAWRPVLQAMAERGETLVITVHCHADLDDPVAVLAARTVRAVAAVWDAASGNKQHRTLNIEPISTLDVR